MQGGSCRSRQPFTSIFVRYGFRDASDPLRYVPSSFFLACLQECAPTKTHTLRSYSCSQSGFRTSMEPFIRRETSAPHIKGSCRHLTLSLVEVNPSCLETLPVFEMLTTAGTSHRPLDHIDPSACPDQILCDAMAPLC